MLKLEYKTTFAAIAVSAKGPAAAVIASDVSPSGLDSLFRSSAGLIVSFPFPCFVIFI